MCDECEVVWLTPESEEVLIPPQPDIPSPITGRSLIGPQAHWCSASEVEAAGWSDSIVGEVQVDNGASAGIDPLVIYFEDSNDEYSLQSWVAAAQGDDRFRVVESGENQSDVELVVVSTELARRASHIRLALEANKHVLAPLPWGDVVESRTLASFSEEQHLSLLGLLQWPNHPRTRAMRAAIDSGKIGPVRRVIIGRSEPDNLGIDRLVIEAVAAAMWACDAPPSSGSTTAMTADAATLTLEFDTAVSLIDVSDDLPKRQWIEIVGLAGSIVCDDFFEPPSGGSARFWIHGRDGTSETVSVADSNGCLETLLAVFRQVRTGNINTGEAYADAAEVGLRLLERDSGSELA